MLQKRRRHQVVARFRLGDAHMGVETDGDSP
jgi:hypothetical protein